MKSLILVHNISDRSDVKDVFYIDESYEVVASSIPSYIGWEIKDSQIGSEIAGKPAELQKIESTEDVLADTAKASFTLNALLDVVPVRTAATSIRVTTNGKKLVMTVGTAALTAGRLVVALEYF